MSMIESPDQRDRNRVYKELGISKNELEVSLNPYLADQASELAWYYAILRQT